MTEHHVVIAGGGFAGLGCAQRLAEHDDIDVTLIDRSDVGHFGRRSSHPRRHR